MKRKWLWRAGIALTILVLIGLAAFLSIDWLAKIVAERRIKGLTGFPTTIGSLAIGFKTASIHLQNFVMKNPPEFGGGTFLEMPELYVKYDRDALRSGRLHLNVVRMDIEKINVVQNKDGQTNVDALQKKQPRKNEAHGASDSSGQPAQTAPPFDGIDFLEVSLNSVQFRSEKNPDENLAQDFGFTREPFHNLKTELDFQTALMVLVLKAGLSGQLDFEIFAKKVPHVKRKRKPVSEENITQPTTNSSHLQTPR